MLQLAVAGETFGAQPPLCERSGAPGGAASAGTDVTCFTITKVLALLLQKYLLYYRSNKRRC